MDPPGQPAGCLLDGVHRRWVGRIAGVAGDDGFDRRLAEWPKRHRSTGAGDALHAARQVVAGLVIHQHEQQDGALLDAIDRGGQGGQVGGRGSFQVIHDDQRRAGRLSDLGDGRSQAGTGAAGAGIRDVCSVAGGEHGRLGCEASLARAGGPGDDQASPDSGTGLAPGPAQGSRLAVTADEGHHRVELDGHVGRRAGSRACVVPSRRGRWPRGPPSRRARARRCPSA